jgi:hypothetical protein
MHAAHSLDLIRDCYQQLMVDLRQSQPPHYTLRLTFRAYNEDAAFCYTVPAQPGLRDFTNHHGREHPLLFYGRSHSLGGVRRESA